MSYMKIRLLIVLVSALLPLSCSTSSDSDKSEALAAQERKQESPSIIRDEAPGTDPAFTPPAFTPADSWEELDEAVFSLPSRSTYRNADELIADLAGIAAGDWEKVRVVWIWMTHNISYDTESFFSGRYGSTDASAVFQSGHSVCEGYSGLFQELAQGLGLEVEKVHGYAKGYGYREGMRDPGGNNHAWNAVQIDGDWHLFDSTWGAGVVNGRHFEWRYNEFYFDTPPDQFIFSHFPEIPDYQLTSDAMSRELFFRLPNLKGDVFGSGLDALVYRQAVEEGRDVGLPTFYPTESPVKLIDFPMLETLNAGETYRISFETDAKWVLVSYGNNKSDTYTARDGRFDIVSSWPRGSVTVFLAPLEATGVYSHNYSGFLRYSVR